MFERANVGAAGSAVTITRVSPPTDDTPAWSVALFAHNEAPRIAKAIAGVAAAVQDARNVEVWVLANGCSDATCDVVRRSGATVRNLWLAEIALADKANAWNVYVHDILTPTRAASVDLHVFTDGDVVLSRNAIELLAAALVQAPHAKAVGGMPATGRDKIDWRRRMVANGVLAGNLYALRGTFIEAVRAAMWRIPTGLIHEDHFVSWLLAMGLDETEDTGQSSRTIFCPTAEFSFRSLSPSRPGDWLTYGRRKRRYALSHLQQEMLWHVLRRGGVQAIPSHVNELYRDAPLPSRLRWLGLVDTPLRLMTVMWIRRFRQRARAAGRLS